MQNNISQIENNMEVASQWLGRCDYASFLKQMEDKTAQVLRAQQNETVFFCEHEHVFTTGKRGINNSLADLGAPFVQTDRGGETTYHGHGQLMMYPILNLKSHGLSVREYVSFLEESVIQLLKTYELNTSRDCGFPGVWLEKEKIAALGIRVSRDITSHGVALNVATDLSWFDKINPCGTSRKATSLEKQGVTISSLEVLSQQWFAIFAQLLKARKL